ncbi:MAG: SDR family oxidoreductase [Polyangiaceae bacterium]|nr:SDR family oxidoreductase [Polyangiaceae bacterium]
MPNVLITGANRGLGLSLSELYLEEGFHVFAGYRTGPEAFNALLQKWSRTLHPVQLEVTRADSVKRAVATVRSLTQSLDILINNAAVLGDTGAPLENVDLALVTRVFETNAVGPLRAVQAFLPLLRAGEHKVIANISSEAGSISTCKRDRMFDYCMSKAALNMESMLLRNYLTDFLVVAIHPGWMRTDMGGKSADLDPHEPARGIVQLIKARPTEPFVVYDGTPMTW